MREIEFRGKSLIEKDKWLVGSLYDEGGEEYILPAFLASALDFENYQVDPNTVGQFTGFWARHGDGEPKKIYEGDTVKVGKLEYLVCWSLKNGRWYLGNGSENPIIWMSITGENSYEVINH